MALEKLKRGCPYGKEITEEIEKGGNAGIETRLAALEATITALLEAGGNEAIIARFAAIESKLDAIESKLAAVLAANAEDDNGKTLQIDSNGKVALVTVV